MNQEQWIKVAIARDAYWLHDGNPKRPHVILTSENHSGGFFNGGLICDGIALLDEACLNLLAKVSPEILDRANHVVGPAMGANSIATMMAHHVQTRWNSVHVDVPREI